MVVAITKNPLSEMLSWFSKFEKNRVPHKNGMPLWSLKVTDTELNELQNMLKIIFGGKEPLVIFNRYSCSGGYSKFDQLFTLYLATWIQRNFCGGRSRWPGVLASLGIIHENRLNTVIYDSVKQGLRYWGISLYATSTANQYFATLYCQGGFPRSGLTGLVSGPVSSYLDRVIEQYSRDHRTSKLVDIANKGLETLPETLKQTPFAALACELITSLLEFRDRYHLYAEADPVSALNFKNPNWRSELPFLLCDEEAHELIGRLLNRAASIIRREQHPVRIRRMLSMNMNGWDLVAETYINQTIHPDDLSRVLSQSTLPIFFDLYTQTDSGERSRSASFNLKGQQNKRWQVITKFTRFYNADASSEIGYEVWSDASLICRDTYYRGEELNDELPWVFSTEGENYLFIGQGSVSTRQGSVFVVHQEKVIPATPQSHVEKISTIQSLGKDIYRVTGKAYVALGTVKLTISSNAEEALEFSCWLQGERCTEAISQKNVFVGRPNVFVRVDTADPIIVDPKELYWQGIDSSALVTLDSNNFEFGLGNIIWIQGGEVKWKSKCALLPENAKFNLLNYGRGEVELKASGFNNTDLGVVKGEAKWLRNVDKYEGMFIAEFQLPAAMSDSFHPILSWNSSLENAVTFEFDSMQSGVCLLTPDGKPYPFKKSILTLDELYNHKLKIKLPSGDNSDSVSVSAALISQHKKIKANASVRIELESSTATISSSVLARLAHSLYSQSDDLYDFVTFKFYGLLPLNARVPKVELFKHPVANFMLNGQLTVKVGKSRQHKNRDEIEMCAAPIWDLSREHIVLNKTTNDFDDLLFLPPKTEEVGPWFIYAKNDRKVQPRAIILSGNCLENIDNNLSRLQLAIRDLPFDRESRTFDYSDMDAALDAVMEDFDSIDWKHIESFVDVLDIATPSTFHIFKRLITKPQVFAGLLLRQSTPESFEQVWAVAAEMPFEWLSVLVSDWKQAAKLVLSHALMAIDGVQTQIPEAQFIQVKLSVLRSRLQMFADKGEYFKTVVEIILEQEYGMQPEWSRLPIYAEANPITGDVNESLISQYHEQKSLLFTRHNGIFLNNIQNKQNDVALRELLEFSLPRSAMPPELRGFVQNNTIEKSKADARAFLLDLPIKIALRNAKVIDIPPFDSRNNLLVNFALNHVQQFDRNWVQQSMACALKAAYIYQNNAAE